MFELTRCAYEGSCCGITPPRAGSFCDGVFMRRDYFSGRSPTCCCLLTRLLEERAAAWLYWISPPPWFPWYVPRRISVLFATGFFCFVKELAGSGR